MSTRSILNLIIVYLQPGYFFFLILFGDKHRNLDTCNGTKVNWKSDFQKYCRKNQNSQNIETVIESNEQRLCFGRDTNNNNSHSCRAIVNQVI